MAVRCERGGLAAPHAALGPCPQNILYRFVKKDWDIVKEGVTWETYDDAEDSRSFKWILSIGGEWAARRLGRRLFACVGERAQ